MSSEVYVKIYTTCGNPCMDPECPKCHGTNLAESLLDFNDFIKDLRNKILEEVKEKYELR